LEHWGTLISHYGYLSIFIVLFFGIIGIPVPDEVLLTYVGYNTYLGRMSFGLSIFISFLGAMIGITISYFLGSKLGEPFLRRFGPKFFIKERTIERTHNLFDRIGGVILFVGYFIPGVRHVTAYIAGILGYSFKRFALFAYAGALLWVATFITLGHLLGIHWMRIEYYFSNYAWIFWVIILIVILVFWFLFRRKKANPDQLSKNPMD
jgi:membrane protein DedA with SNARE-associated domain